MGGRDSFSVRNQSSGEQPNQNQIHLKAGKGSKKHEKNRTNRFQERRLYTSSRQEISKQSEKTLQQHQNKNSSLKDGGVSTMRRDNPISKLFEEVYGESKSSKDSSEFKEP